MAPLSLLALPWLCPSLFALPLQPEAATRLHVSVSAWLLWERDLVHGPSILGGLQHQGHLSGKGQMQVRIFRPLLESTSGYQQDLEGYFCALTH